MKKIFEENYYTVPEIAEILGLSLNTIRIYCKNERFASVKIGKNWYVSELNFKNYLNTQNKANANE